MRSNQEADQVPWNIGRIIGPKPPLKPKHIWAIRTRLQHEGRVRDLAMFNVAIDSKLRGCDLVRLRAGDIHLRLDPASNHHCATEDRTARAVRADRANPGSTCALAPASQAARKRLAFPEPEPPRRPPNDPPIRSFAGRLGCADRAGSGRLRHAQSPPNKGCAPLQTHRQSAGLPTPAWPFQTGEHRSVPRDRGR